MERRDFLKASTLLLAAPAASGVLAACGGGSGDGIPEGAAELNPVVATFELLTGGTRSVLFGLRTLDNVEVPESDVTVYLRDTNGETLLAGPLETEYVVAPGTEIGLYRVELPLEEPGNPQLVAVEGDRYGATNLNVVAPENAKAPAPGTAATVVATPTEGDDMGYTRICTQNPPCGMHEESLDEVLDAGRPVMLIFATPEFCQTVVCGPAVATIEDVRKDGDWGDTAWIHVEIYSEYEEGNPTLGKPVREWNLPTEPWLFSIDGEGQIVERLDGPMVTEDIESMAGGLTA